MSINTLEECKRALSQMATPVFRKEMSALIRSRTPLVYLVSTEESRILEYFRCYSQLGAFRTLAWDCFGGLVNIENLQPCGLLTGDISDATVVLDWIIKETANNDAVQSVASESNKVAFRGHIYVLLDFHRYLKPCTPEIERRLRTIARNSSNTVVVMVGPHYEAVAALDKDVRVIDFPYPSRTEIKDMLYSALEKAPGLPSSVVVETKKNEKDIINAVLGLSNAEIRTAFGKSIVIHAKVDIPTLLQEKRDVIRKTGVLEYFDSEIGLDDIGGLGNLVTWLQERRDLFHEDARAYGLPVPKGVLLIGVPGAGKSLAAKATAKAYQIPLLRLDFGALFGSYVGESEKQARLALQIADRLSPVVLWCDEIDKGLSGHQSSGRSDSGVTSRVISAFLTWLQEKSSSVFFICTANQHECIPTEFMRAGRFDEIFFIDLPSLGERVDIAYKLLRRKGRNPKEFDCRQIAVRSDGHTGAEIEKAIDIALIKGFRENRRQITDIDIIKAFDRFVPLSKTRPEAIEAMRAWSNGRCVIANTVTPPVNSRVVSLELNEESNK